jgi:hypothetical protein
VSSNSAMSGGEGVGGEAQCTCGGAEVAVQDESDDREIHQDTGERTGGACGEGVVGVCVGASSSGSGTNLMFAQSEQKTFK